VTGGVVRGVTPAGVTPNFHTAEITLSHGTVNIAVLGHAERPLMAFAQPLRNFWDRSAKITR
jgi:hypothetical protein